MSPQQHYTLADGRQIRECSGVTWQLLTINGVHICYLRSETVDYSRGLR